MEVLETKNLRRGHTLYSTIFVDELGHPFKYKILSVRRYKNRWNIIRIDLKWKRYRFAITEQDLKNFERDEVKALVKYNSSYHPEWEMDECIRQAILTLYDNPTESDIEGYIAMFNPTLKINERE